MNQIQNEIHAADGIEGEFNQVETNRMDLEKMAKKIENLEIALKNATKPEPVMQQLSQMIWQFGEKFGAMKENIAGKDQKVEKEFADLKVGFAKLAEENAKLKEEIGKLSKAQIPANCADGNGIFNFFKADHPLGQLLEAIKELEAYKKELIENDSELVALKGNKMNLGDFNSKLAISEQGLKIVYKWEGKYYQYGAGEMYTVRAELPVQLICKKTLLKKRYIACYYEVKILTKNYPNSFTSFSFGFCDQKFPLKDKMVGQGPNSIGIEYIGNSWIDGTFSPFGIGKHETSPILFNENDVIGCGLLCCPANESIKFFATYNGTLLAIRELPSKFVGKLLFPGISMQYSNDAVLVNFGLDAWCFDPTLLV